ncbi:DUF6519 domain-containing protein [Aliiroseovarius sp. YM-037]|uniref:DUF6519 domain-containing protein n=1 Tax=Aliiroseovarius sp. YM-037 TaxID=3341728 RepID=UPI003A809DF0
MSGDYSRFSHDALRRYSALLMQQGRVLLDSDFNELVEIVSDRIGKLSFDAMGNPGIPLLTNPDAFLVSLEAGPPLDLSLTPGRIYLDFLMAEIFEGETVTYLGQPFLPDPPPLPDGDAAIYLEIYEEELTWVEAPLLDAALGGVDTTTRTRVNWVLRVNEVDVGECGLDVGDPPSAGRLTTQAVAPPAPDDPCILPPASGYRGLENRLYRVEVHEGGALGTARFKWSRDHNSIVSPVSDIAPAGPQTVLTVARIGRDPVMRFIAGDWVTITDDHREWMDEPGEMAQVIDTDEANSTITIDRVIPSGGGRAFGGDATALADRHTRVQKWNQTAATNTVDGDGLIATGAGPIPVEEGIELVFSTDPAGGEFRRGDYWSFWARTATASIEELSDAPPRGIIRHYVQLAAANGLGGANPNLIDCRPQEEPDGDGCCTIVVQPGDSIQDAIDALPPQGGCICIKAGVHPVPATLVIDLANVHMHGESPGAILTGTAPLLQMGVSGQSIRIDTLDFLARVPDGGITPIIASGGTNDLTIEDCRIAPLPGTSGGVAISLTRTDRARIVGNAIFNTDVGVLVSGLCSLPVIEDNGMLFGLGLESAPVATGIWITGNPSACFIEDNVILGAHQGIVVNDAPFAAPRSMSASTMIADNAILTGVRQGEGDGRARGIDAAADFMTVKGNTIAIAAPAGMGIRATGSGSTITENKIGALAQSEVPAFGIQLGYEGEGAGLSNGLIARDNQIAGQLIGVLLTQTTGAAVVGNNIVAVEQVPVFGILSLNAPLQRFTDNRIAGTFVGIYTNQGRDSRIEGNDVIGGVGGILVQGDLRPTLQGNRLGGCRGLGAVAFEIIGRTEFIANKVTNAGSAVARSIGLGAFMVLGEWHVESNEVSDTGVPIDGDGASTEAWGIWGDLIQEARIESNLVTYSDALSRDVTREDRALMMRGLLEFRVQLGAGEVVFGFPIQIVDNKFIGTGASALVELAQLPVNDNIRIRFERVFFSNNYCMHASGAPNDSVATVVLVGRGCTVTGNQVKATAPGFFSFDFNGMRGPYVGNITTGNALSYNPFPPAADGLHNFIL